MDYTKLTVAALTENRADLVAEIKAAAVASVDKPDLDAIRAAAAADERKRITAIEALAMPGTEDVIAACKADGSTPEQAAVKIVQAAKAAPATPAKPDAGAAHIAGLKKTESDLEAPKAGSGKDDDDLSDEDAATAAVAMARKAGIID